MDEWWAAHRFEFIVLRPLAFGLAMLLVAWLIWRERKR